MLGTGIKLYQNIPFHIISLNEKNELIYLGDKLESNLKILIQEKNDLKDFLIENVLAVLTTVTQGGQGRFDIYFVLFSSVPATWAELA